MSNCKIIGLCRWSLNFVLVVSLYLSFSVTVTNNKGSSVLEVKEVYGLRVKT